LTESNIIQQLQEGNPTAFKELVATYQDLVYNTALGFVQNEADAEDISQDVFIQVYKSIGQFKGESKLSTWLYRITSTKSLDFLRNKKRKKRFALISSLFGENNELIHDPVDFYHPGVAYDKKEQAAAVFQIVKKLPDNQKTAFILHHTEELSYQEIAQIMQLSVSAVESLLFRARQNLKKTLNKNNIR
jgi:RNA polymerase sigma factor (sigma-70 family)